MQKEIDIKKELLKSIIAVVRHKEFYGHIVQQFQKVFVSGDHPVNTAAVGRFKGEKFIKLIYNEDFFKGIYDEQMSSNKDKSLALKKARLLSAGVTEHEILHVVFGHLTSTFNYADKQRGNIAMDCVINQNIADERRQDFWIMPDRYGFPNDQTSKWYYDNLKDNKQYNEDVKGGVYGGMFCSHELWDELENDPLAKEFIKDVIRKAKDNTTPEGWGNVSSNVKEAVDALLEWQPSQVPWAKAFRNFCASSEESVMEYTMSRISRRFGTRPGTRRRDMLNIAIIIDTSGSINDDQLKTFFNEVRWIWRNGAVVHIFEADVDIQSDYRFTGKFKGEVSGRGGTDLERPLTKVDKMRKFDCIVYFTDFYASQISRKPNTPVMWVLSDPPDKSNWPCDWGKAVEIDTVA
jgi:predicted metal-dependent peptidase